MAFEIVTVREAREIPCGRRTGQRRSLASTHSSSVALPGGCSVADWRMRKSGPICTTGMEVPLSSKPHLHLGRVATLNEHTWNLFVGVPGCPEKLAHGNSFVPE
jgi:hypothetical protein